MSSHYLGRRRDIAGILPVISLIFALLAVLAAGFFYADSRKYKDATNFAMARAAGPNLGPIVAGIFDEFF